MTNKKFEIIRVSGIAMGVGFTENLPDGSGQYSEGICETLYDTGNDEKDAAESEKWAKIICDSLNGQEAIAFAEWLRKCYTPIEGSELWMQSCTHPDFVGQKKPRVPDMTHYTLNELYQIFKQNNP